MALTPVEIRHLKPARGVLGYKRAVVDRLLVEIAESYGDVWRDRADLTDKIEQLEADLVRHKELEGLLLDDFEGALWSRELLEKARDSHFHANGDSHFHARSETARYGGAESDCPLHGGDRKSVV